MKKSYICLVFFVSFSLNFGITNTHIHVLKRIQSKVSQETSSIATECDTCAIYCNAHVEFSIRFWFWLWHVSSDLLVPECWIIQQKWNTNEYLILHIFRLFPRKYSYATKRFSGDLEEWFKHRRQNQLDSCVANVWIHFRPSRRWHNQQWMLSKTKWNNRLSYQFQIVEMKMSLALTTYVGL